MDAAAGTPISTPRRRNSIGTPSTLTLHSKHHYPSSSSSSISTTTTTTTNTTTSSSSSSSSSSADFELVSLKPASYTSLRDILPSPAAVVQSPKLPSAVHSGYEISIRNRLVKQAAWAYLQPMSTSPDSGGATVFHRLWNRFSDAFFRLITQICDCFLRSIRL